MNRWQINRTFGALAALAAVAALTLPGHSAVAAVPTTASVEGVLLSTGGGAAADGTYAVTFGIYAQAVGGTPVWSEGPVNVASKAGQFTYQLGSKTPLSAAALSGTSFFLGMQIGADPELPRVALNASAFALRAAVAEGVECSGCIKGAMIDAGVLQPYAKTADLAPYAKTADLSVYAKSADLSAYAKSSDLGAYAKSTDLADYVKAASLAKVAGTGSYADLLNAPALAKVATSGDFADLKNQPSIPQVGKLCGTGLYFKGYNADGSINCVKLVEGDMPPDGIDEVTNGLVWNQFTDSTAGTADVGIKQGGGAGVTDTLVFPDIGLAQKIWIDFSATHSDVSKLSIDLYGPNMANPYSLYKGSKTGASMTMSFNNTDPIAAGDMNKDWVGKNIAGSWSIVVKSAVSGNAVDGKFNWTLKIQTLSNKKIQIKGDLIVDGAVNFKGNAAIGGTVTTNSPQMQKFNRKYTVVLALRSATNCPSGYTQTLAKDIRGPNNYVYGNLTEHGNYMGAMNSLGYGNEHLYWGFNYQNLAGDSSVICSKTFDAPNGQPFVHAYTYYGGDKTQCMSGYNWVPASETRGNNDWSYMIASDAGAFFGYIDTWDYNAQATDDLGGGSIRRHYQTGHASNLCFRVYGVADDPATQNGVFPVQLGVTSKAECPAGWDARPVTDWDRWDGWYYNSFTPTAWFSGGMYDWWQTGNYMQESFHNSHVAFLCTKIFPKRATPYVRVTTLTYSSACPANTIAINAAALKGWNGNAYLHQTTGGLYMGGLNGWGSQDLTRGFIQWNYTDQVQTKVCLGIDNVDNFP